MAEEKKQTCQLCSFRNPKGTATAVILMDNKLLLLKRKQEPYKGRWDLPGGFMKEGETPEETIRREISEELEVEIIGLIPLRPILGTHEWQGEIFPVLSHFFLVEIKEKSQIKLNEESSEFSWISLKEINPGEVFPDSNRKMVLWLKERFIFDINQLKELVKQLDSSAEIREYSIYRAILNGYIAKKYDGEELIGMGWIFPRQTLLRKQAVVEDMIVDEAYRGKGYGWAILQDLINWARENGIEVIELTSHPKRVAANELYKKAGFQLHETNHYLYRIDKE